MVRRTHANDRLQLGLGLLSIVFFLVTMILMILGAWWSLEGCRHILRLWRIWLIGPAG